jgi:hypothetical protein
LILEDMYYQNRRFWTRSGKTEHESSTLGRKGTDQILPS